MLTMNHRRKRNDPSNGGRTQMMQGTGTPAPPSIARLTESARKFLSFRLPRNAATLPSKAAIPSANVSSSSTTITTQPMSNSEMDGRATTLQKSRLVLGVSAESLVPEIFLEDDDANDQVNGSRATTLRKSRPPLLGVDAESFLEGMYLEDDDEDDDDDDSSDQDTSTRDIMLTPTASRSSKLTAVPDFAPSPDRSAAIVEDDESDGTSNSPTCRAPADFIPECATKAPTTTTTIKPTIIAATLVPAPKPIASSPTKRRRSPKTRQDLQRPSLRDFLAATTADHHHDTTRTFPNDKRHYSETKSCQDGVVGGGGRHSSGRSTTGVQRRRKEFTSLRDIISEYESIVGDVEQ
jgi:hypothetical protein